MAAYNAECRGVGVSFVPFAVESLGGWAMKQPYKSPKSAD